MPNGTIKTFSRGGSDVTGSIVARAAGRRFMKTGQTLVDALFADPRIVNNPAPINTITYSRT